MSTANNQELVQQFVEQFWNQGRLDSADTLLTADAAIYLPGHGQVDMATLKLFAATMRGAFPDWHSTVEAMLAQGDQVVERFTGRGTHRGVFQGVAPTGRVVAVPGVVFYRLSAGRIAEFRGLLDSLSLLQQIGALPMAAEAA